MYLHYFCDEIDHQTSLDPTDRTGYSVRMPLPTVRVRVYDGSKVYHLFEKTVTVPDGGLELDIPLERTNYVRLFGNLVEKATGRRMKRGEDGGHGPLLYFGDGKGYHAGPEWLEDDGSYSLRVPRGKITVRAVDTAKSIAVPTVDLTEVEGDEYRFDIALD